MNTRTINFDKLIEWAKANDVATVTLAAKVKCSPTMARELLNGTYNSGRAPRELYMVSLCRVTGIPKDELFPLSAATDEEAA